MPEEPKFLVDFMLGRLAKWLRIMGCDSEYCRDTDRQKILCKSLQEKRVILTRDHNLSKKRAWELHLIKSDFIEEQIRQVKSDFNISPDTGQILSRCTICNVPIMPIEKEKIKGRVPPFIYETHNDFSCCPKCNRVYWPGTHLNHVVKTLKVKNRDVP
ncbi:MAG: Mut7-C RNAse domain-containing protein [Elusimicrobiota bacterium]